MPAPVVHTKHPSEQRQKPGYDGLKVKRKSSKPIINWLQRKLGNTVRGRRVSSPTPITYSGRPSGQLAAAKASHTRYAASLTDSPEVRASKGGHGANAKGHAEEAFQTNPELKAGRVNGEDGGAESDEAASARISSVAAVSIWSRSNPLEADEDASIIPLPPTTPPSPSPTTPPSPSPSRDSSSYLSDPRTFQSITASTKPTTVMSIDLPTMAHIAQAPPTPTTATIPAHPPSPASRFPPHIRTSSNMSSMGGSTSIAFSALPSSPQSSRPSSLNPMRTPAVGGSTTVQAPQYTSYHPRNNPRPSSPPLDNASVLTLASSAFLNTTRNGTYAWTLADSISHFNPSDSVSHIVMDDMLLAEDKDASVRALRPRSSRRGSWESEASGWSARFAGARERSLMIAPSFRTGGQMTMDDQGDQDEDASLLDNDTLSRAEREDMDDNLMVMSPTIESLPDGDLTSVGTTTSIDGDVPLSKGRSVSDELSVQTESPTAPSIIISSEHDIRKECNIAQAINENNRGSRDTLPAEDQTRHDVTPKAEEPALPDQVI